jgi:hypothetical protein
MITYSDIQTCTVLLSYNTVYITSVLIMKHYWNADIIQNKHNIITCARHTYDYTSKVELIPL